MKNTPSQTPRLPRISLHPLTLEEALRRAMQGPVAPKPDPKPRTAPKKSKD